MYVPYLKQPQPLCVIFSVWPQANKQHTCTQYYAQCTSVGLTLPNHWKWMVLSSEHIMGQLGIWCNIPCEWTQVRRSKVMSRTPTRYKTCIKRSRGIVWWHILLSNFVSFAGYKAWCLVINFALVVKVYVCHWLLFYWLSSTVIARDICSLFPYHQCYLLYNLSFCICLVLYRPASISIWLVGSPLRNENIVINEWMKSHKMHVYVQCFNFSFEAWKDILKFDTTARHSCHWSIFRLKHKATER